MLLTLVRHGESVDNLTSLWAGHRDAPLTNHGMNQARRLATSFSSTPITAIYASDLSRAQTTARAIHDHFEGPEGGQGGVKARECPFVTTKWLREQYFGDAEGQEWDAGTFSYKSIPWAESRSWKFPSGESREDVTRRGNAVLRRFVFPHLLDESKSTVKGNGEVHVLLAAHGIMISETVEALSRATKQSKKYEAGWNLENTGWHRFRITFQNSDLPDLSTGSFPSSSSPPAEEPSTFPVPEEEYGDESGAVGLPIEVVLLDSSQSGHLKGLVRQKGGIGSSAFDPNQRTLKDFFAGGGTQGTPSKAA